jgi:hypothetical protein
MGRGSSIRPIDPRRRLVGQTADRGTIRFALGRWNRDRIRSKITGVRLNDPMGGMV